MRNCITCGKRLHGGGCRDHLEGECCEGGGFEAWQPRTNFVFYDMVEDYLAEIGWTGDYTVKKEKGHYVLTLLP